MIEDRLEVGGQAAEQGMAANPPGGHMDDPGDFRVRTRVADGISQELLPQEFRRPAGPALGGTRPQVRAKPCRIIHPQERENLLEGGGGCQRGAAARTDRARRVNGIRREVT